MEKLTIKSYGVKITLPSEILILKDCPWAAKAHDHLVLGKAKNNMGEECFIILRKNGVVNNGILIYPSNVSNLRYQACTSERYYKMRSFL